MLKKNNNKMINKIVEGRRKIISEIDDFDDEEVERLKTYITNLPSHKNEIYTNISDLVKQLNLINNYIRFDKLKNREGELDLTILKRDLKFLGDLTGDFEKTTSEITVLNNRLELTFEDIINTLKKYYKINGLEDEILDDTNIVSDQEVEAEIEEIEESLFKRFKNN